VLYEPLAGFRNPDDWRHRVTPVMSGVGVGGAGPGDIRAPHDPNLRGRLLPDMCFQERPSQLLPDRRLFAQLRTAEGIPQAFDRNTLARARPVPRQSPLAQDRRTSRKPENLYCYPRARNRRTRLDDCMPRELRRPVIPERRRGAGGWPPGKPRHGEIESAPKEMNGTDFADEPGAKSPKDAVDCD
jgi:hypothetical protein